jgi:hypothetical protein
MQNTNTATAAETSTPPSASGSPTQPIISISTSNRLTLGLNKCSNTDYHADRTAISSSVVKTIYKDLAQYHREYILGEKEEIKNKSALVVGSLVHSLILEPHLVHTEYNFVKAWDRRTKEYKDIIAALPASDKRTIVTQTEKATADSLVKAHKRHSVAPSYFSGGEAEVTIVAIYNIVTDTISFDEADEGPDTVRIKVRFDYINVDKGFISDAKTTGYSADHTSFKATCEGLMYELSGALYLMVAEAYYKRSFDFYFDVLSKKDQECEVYKLSMNSRIKGLQKIKNALEKYRVARASGKWTESSVNSTPASANSEYVVLEV